MSSSAPVIPSPQARAKPFLKWPGGKRWLTRHLLGLLNGSSYRRYFEPFLGGGALFFALQPEKAALSDVNSDLINVYVQVRNRPHELIRRLKDLSVDKATYARFRSADPKLNLDRAVRFLYLNRTAFGGMYRLNRQGSFNVPFGGGQRTPEPLWNENLLQEASKALKGAQLQTSDFQELLADAGEGDLVYCDPTYTVAHNNNGFVRYNERNFSWDDQKRLADTCQRLAREGATVLVSNADHDDIIRLYDPTRVYRLDRMSVLCPASEKRKPTTELLLLFDSRRTKRPAQRVRRPFGRITPDA
jgi:DNA adenine methylase